MRTGWFQDGDSWYYLADDGKMQTGWITVDGKEYYLEDSGQMAHDTTVDGKELGSDGAKEDFEKNFQVYLKRKKQEWMDSARKRGSSAPVCSAGENSGGHLCLIFAKEFSIVNTALA